MAIEAFAACYADYVGVTVDSVIDDLRQAGAQNIDRFLTWWQSLTPQSIALMQTLAASSTAVLVLILTKLGAEIAACIVALLGGASWALLVKAMLHCRQALWA